MSSAGTWASSRDPPPAGRVPDVGDARSDFMGLTLRPIDLVTARRFVAEYHRHNIPPVGWKWGVGVECEGVLVGVAMASRPVARNLDDGRTLEVIRTCTTGAKNANSMLYGAIARAAKALGYSKLVTYTLASEPGTSLRAAGWAACAEVAAARTWSSEGHRRQRYQENLFGEQRRPMEAKTRWEKSL